MKLMLCLFYRQVLQVREEQVEQALEEVPLSRLLPPPMPKEEKTLVISGLWQAGHVTSFSPPIFVRHSKR